jgi:hypothetical protein
MNKSEVILVFGRICSGKSTFQSQQHRIIVSNIVRSLLDTNDRSVLQNSLNMDMKIAEEIVSCIEEIKVGMKYNLIKHKNIIVDGIRQTSIVDYILERYPDAKLVWLQVPTEKRRQRYELRADSKDTESFDVADNKPIELECQKIFSIFEDKLQIINNY